ncbi:MAG: Atrophin-1 multi-domain protein, partial [Duganella sp.]
MFKKQASHPLHRLVSVCIATTMAACVASASAQTSLTNVAPPAFGTHATPFNADSLWNSRPIKPKFGTFVIPKSSYYPAIMSGAFSTGLYLAKPTDSPMTVVGFAGTGGVDDPDSQTKRSVTLPRWPAAAVPASGTDGHMDIYDPVTNIIHSFWKLKKVNGVWNATLYAWSPADGSGFGDPAHFYRGARAAGVVSSAGLIRAAEVKDGLPHFRHALVMSLTFNGLSGKTPYIYPATSADTDAAKSNTGEIPEGALLMLPPDYDTSKIANADLRKVAETLKIFGAYVVDRNDGTPFAIYVEQGVPYDLHNGGWNNAVAAELDRIRANLRQVVSAEKWVDGNGKATVFKQAETNILSMRGPWKRDWGTTTGSFNTWTQSLEFPAASTSTGMSNGNSTGLSKIIWAKPAVGDNLKFTVQATGGAKLRIVVYSGSKQVVDTGNLSDQQSARFTWPTGAWFVLYATSGVNVASSVRADL